MCRERKREQMLRALSNPGEALAFLRGFAVRMESSLSETIATLDGNAEDAADTIASIYRIVQTLEAEHAECERLRRKLVAYN